MDLVVQPTTTIASTTVTFTIADGSTPKFILPTFTDQSAKTCAVTGYDAYDSVADAALADLTASVVSSNVEVAASNLYIEQTYIFTLKISFDGGQTHFYGTPT